MGKVVVLEHSPFQDQVWDEAGAALTGVLSVGNPLKYVPWQLHFLPVAF